MGTGVAVGIGGGNGVSVGSGVGVLVSVAVGVSVGSDVGVLVSVAVGISVGSDVIHLVQSQSFELSAKMSVLSLLGGIIGGMGFYAILVALRLGGQGSVVFPISGLGVIVAVILAFYLSEILFPDDGRRFRASKHSCDFAV